MTEEIPRISQDRINSFELKLLTNEEKKEVSDRLYSDPGLKAQHSCLEVWARKKALSIIEPNTVRFIATQHGLRQLSEEILLEGNSALERMFVEQIVTNMVLNESSGYLLNSIEWTPETRHLCSHLDITHHRAHARLIKAIWGLCQVRKLTLDTNIREFKKKRL